MIKENPARRLQVFTDTCYSYEGPHKNPKEIMKVIIEPTTEADYYKAISDLYELADRVRDLAYQDYFDFKDGAIYVHSQFYHFMNYVQTNRAWEDSKAYLDSHFHTYLRMIANVFESNAAKNMSDDEVRKIKESISSTLELVLDSEDLSEPMKMYLTSKLTSIIQKLETYQITGIEPALETIESMFGHAAMDEEFRSTLKECKDGTAHRALTKVAEVATIIAATTGVYSIAPSVVALISK